MPVPYFKMKRIADKQRRAVAADAKASTPPRIIKCWYCGARRHQGIR